MSWFLNLKTKTKLFIGFGLLIVMMIAVVDMAYQEIGAMRVAQQQLYDRDFSDAVDLASIRAFGNGMRADMLTMMLFTKRSDQEAWHSSVKDRTREMNEAMQRLLERPHSDQATLAKLKEVQAILKNYEEVRDEQVIPLVYAGKLKEARDLAISKQAERFTRFRSLLLELGDAADRNAKAGVEQSWRNADKTIHGLVVITIAAVCIAVAMTVLMARLIADPLKNISDIASRVASGDLAANITPSSRVDEVGVLSQAFHNMVDALRKLTIEIREGMNILASSSSEILATTAQVASSATETATAVSQTTTTVEEVKQTALISNQKAKQVSERVQKTAQVSQAGQQAVEQMMGGMSRIRQQTVSTAESIVKLSEQGQVIGEIIATVNDLAEQSNVLAVNAAIEASKAGEHGRGFTVVAQEIRSLAEQSKQATSQVRSILGDIQKSTGAAVMAIDLTGKAVDAGMQQSDAAGNAIQMLSGGAEEAAQAAVQIAASSQEQLVGMDQVVSAMESIKQATAQNMAGTRQAEAAAQNLHELGLKLKQMVEQYRV